MIFVARLLKFSKYLEKLQEKFVFGKPNSVRICTIIMGPHFQLHQLPWRDGGQQQERSGPPAPDSASSEESHRAQYKG